MKKILTLLLVITILFSFSGCNGDDLKNYSEAVKKTSSILKGQMEISMDTDLDISTDELTKEQKKAIKYFKNLEGKMNIKFDDESKKFISRNYFSFGGLGMDSNVYGNGEQIYLQMPIIGKYIDISQEYKKETKQDSGSFLSEDTKEKIGNKWLNILQEDDIFTGQDTIMDTPDGEVKVTEYNIHIEDNQLKEFALSVVDIVAKDEDFIKNLNKEIEEVEGEDKVNSDELIKNIKKMIKGAGIEAFNYTAYVDIDGYIVKEIIEVNMDSNESEIINGAKFNMEINTWDIEEEQEFDFPDINEDNILNRDEIEDGMPFIFENIEE